MSSTPFRSTVKKKGWELFAHQADIGVRGLGNTKSEAFEQAALALTAVITNPEKIELNRFVEICCRNDDDEMLLVEWLNALIYEMSIHKLLFGSYKVTIDNGCLRARAWGESVNIARHQPAVEPKGATFTCLRVAQSDEGRWLAQAVIDV